MKDGPLEADYRVYEDFFSYKSGIYKHVRGRDIAGHTTRVIGWGVSNGVRYWICCNSWGRAWGENGYFRMAFG